MHALSGNRIRDLSNQAVSDQRLRQYGRRNRLSGKHVEVTVLK